mmetsp:Transcript_91920/g.297326  ORF Transcript_91920/g.297326 Transcript_91920/m.297326 type:complete len:673 (-) Transcript_91920:55-2073(-)
MPSIWSCAKGRGSGGDDEYGHTDAEAEKALEEALELIAKGSASLSLTGRFIGDRLCERLAENLALNPCVRWLQLDRNLLGDTSALALASMLSRPDVAVQSLDLDFNRISDTGAGHLSDALEVNTSLRELQLHCNAIGPKGAAVLAKALKSNSSLRALSLHGNAIGDSGAIALAEVLQVNASLHTLSLHGTGVGDAGASKIAEMLEVNSSLREVSLGGNSIGNDAAAKFGKMIAMNSTLQELHLNNNLISDDGASLIAEGLKTNNCLRELWLVNNTISSKGVLVFAEALEENTALSRLGLTATVRDEPSAMSKPAGPSPSAQEAMMALQRCHTLRKAVKHVDDGQDTLHIAGATFNERGIQRLAMAIKRSGTLSDLKLENCSIDDNGAEQLAEALETNRSMTRVSLINNSIGDHGATRLAAALERNDKLENLDLEGNPISDEVSSVISTPRLSTPRWGSSSASTSASAGGPRQIGGASAAHVSLDIGRMSAAAAKAKAAAKGHKRDDGTLVGGSSPGGDDGMATLFPGEDRDTHNQELASEVASSSTREQEDDYDESLGDHDPERLRGAVASSVGRTKGANLRATSGQLDSVAEGAEGEANWDWSKQVGGQQEEWGGEDGADQHWEEGWQEPGWQEGALGDAGWEEGGWQEGYAEDHGAGAVDPSYGKITGGL